MIGTIACLIAIIMTGLFFRWKRQASLFSFLPFAPYVPIFGSAFFLESDPSSLHHQFGDFRKDKGYLYVLWLFLFLTILLVWLRFEMKNKNGDLPSWFSFLLHLKQLANIISAPVYWLPWLHNGCLTIHIS